MPPRVRTGAIVARPASAAAATLGGEGVRTMHAPISANSASAFSVVVISWARAPVRTPRHRRIVNAAMTADAVTAAGGAERGASAASASPSTMDTAATLPDVEIQSLHPTTNAGYSPSAPRANTYCPPDRGIIAPSSARETAPSNAYRAPTTQTDTNTVVLGTFAATSLGARRIPAPM